MSQNSNEDFRLKDRLIERHHLKPDHFLGEGSEAVFFLQGETVLRFMRGSLNAGKSKAKKMQAFYRDLNSQDLGFEIPQIYSIEDFQGICLCKEKFLGRKTLESALIEADQELQDQLISQYFNLVKAVQKLVSYQFNAYGEILSDSVLQRNDWSQFLVDRASQALEKSLGSLREDIPGFDDLLTQWQNAVLAIENPVPSLVHGDLYPPNVMVERGSIHALIDFSPISIVGDWRMDLVGGSIFLEICKSHQREQRILFDSMIWQDAECNLDQNLFDLYTIYYGIYFSAYAVPKSGELYRWCVKRIVEAAQRSLFHASPTA